MDFTVRSPRLEWLDRPDIPAADIRRNMRELASINRWLGGHAVTRAGLREVLGGAAEGKRVSLCEIGCGGGDNLLAIAHWAARQGIAVSLTGIDINPDCIASAEEAWPPGFARPRFVVGDYREFRPGEDKPDIVFSALFCHHFPDQELVSMLGWMAQNSRKGFFINDLHRHPFAWYSIRALTRLFSRSYLVKHDAPLSVLRGFSRRDWEKICGRAELPAARVRWRWAFRWLVSVRHHAG